MNGATVYLKYTISWYGQLLMGLCFMLPLMRDGSSARRESGGLPTPRSDGQGRPGATRSIDYLSH